MTEYLTPGVYQDTVVLDAPPRLATGVPGFAGFAHALSPPPVPKDGSPPPPVTALLTRKEDFAAVYATPAPAYLLDAVSGFFDNGGERCYVAAVDRTGGLDTSADALVRAIDALTDLPVDLVAAPDAVALISASAVVGKRTKYIDQVQHALLSHCATLGDRFALVDALGGFSDPARQRARLIDGLSEPIDGALYYPWVIAGPAPGRPVPPSGHVAGVIASTDVQAGVFKAPANREIRGVLDAAVRVDAGAQADLNTAGVNCLRVFPGRGVRVWGARTLSAQPEWRYVNVRRTFLTLRRWIDLNLAWVTFEPNAPQLWLRIRRTLEVYLTQLWRDGALAGGTPAQAFYVKCDLETNPQDSREQGAVVTEIGLAPASPAEFVVVRIVQQVSPN